MPKLVPIVEGDGETTAFPVLLRKLLDERERYDIQVDNPKNAKGRNNLTKPGGLERFVELVRREAQQDGVILILLDAEDECPLAICKTFAERIKAAQVNCSAVLVVANRMYENWLIASAESIRGQTLDGRAGLFADAPLPEECEKGKGKTWINQNLPTGRSYKETLDQEAMTRLLNTELARKNSRSFRRLDHAVEQAVRALDENLQDFLSPFAPSLPHPQAAIAPPVSRRRKNQI